MFRCYSFGSSKYGYVVDASIELPICSFIWREVWHTEFIPKSIEIPENFDRAASRYIEKRIKENV